MLFIGMAPEFFLQSECLRTLVTLMRHNLMDESAVQLQSRRDHEALSAEVTLVRTDAFVQLLVTLQMAFVREELVALATLVGRLCVTVHAFLVQIKSGGVKKCITTFYADAALLARVRKLMQLQLRSATGRERAQVAMPGFGVRLVDADVLLERALQRKNLVALLALKAVLGLG